MVSRAKVCRSTATTARENPETARLSYHLCYHVAMAQRDKRSVSFPPELAHDIDEAAAEAGTSFSAWIADRVTPAPSGGRPAWGGGVGA